MSATRTCAQTEHIVGQLLATIPRHGGRGNLPREEIRGVVAGCLDLVARDQPHPTTRVSRIHRAAVRWAAVGVPIETVHGMVREGFRLHRDGPAPYCPSHGEIGRLMDALHAVTATVSADRIPAAAGIAHELLDVARRLYGRPGLYRFDDLALEYQLTRPGPGRDRLTAVPDPLAAHPELPRTLRVHVRNDINRRLTARALHIHQNTVDHRLERIGVLVGLDSARPTSLWRLRAALVARSYTHPDEPGSGRLSRTRPTWLTATVVDVHYRGGRGVRLPRNGAA
ncbi:PucR family transcriptional regulator [Nocardia sp. NBC_01377]|uniref:PucR family transcriptional regulator n=1 Tax=Nocardia sp. NBC_01377 TaxID=2903595 RepID=UPI00386F736C